MDSRLRPPDLFEIRQYAARAGSFQGYRAAPVAFSGAVALGAGLIQVALRPGDRAFVLLWSVAACVGFGYNLLCISRTYGASPRRWERSLAFAALTDLSPAVLAGMFLTVVLSAKGQVEMLPGLWMMLFGTGLMASRRHLPVVGSLMGAAYILAGTATLCFLDGGEALRAEVMAGVFGIGQFMLAFILSRTQW
jgi:hypothetical protein